jgi:uncharacterized protein (DUF433 family)
MAHEGVDLNVQASREAVEEWIVERLTHARAMLHDAVDVDPDTRGGVLVLRGTRFPVTRVLAEIADDNAISQLAEDFDLDVELLRKLLQGMAICLERPVAE